MQVPKAVRVMLDGAGHHFHVHVSNAGEAKVTCMLGTIVCEAASDGAINICELPVGGQLGTWRGCMPMRNIVAFAYKSYLTTDAATHLTQAWLLQTSDNHTQVQVCARDGVLTNLHPSNLDVCRPSDIETFMGIITLPGGVCFARSNSKATAWDSEARDCVCGSDVCEEGGCVCIEHAACTTVVAATMQRVLQGLRVHVLRSLRAASTLDKGGDCGGCGGLSCHACVSERLMRPMPVPGILPRDQYAVNAALALHDVDFRRLDLPVQGKCLVMMPSGRRLCNRDCLKADDYVCLHHLLHSTGPGIRACVRKHVAYAMEGATEGPADLVAWGYRPVLGDADASKMRGTFAKYAVLLRALLKDSVAS